MRRQATLRADLMRFCIRDNRRDARPHHPHALPLQVARIGLSGAGHDLAIKEASRKGPSRVSSPSNSFNSASPAKARGAFLHAAIEYAGTYEVVRRLE